MSATQSEQPTRPTKTMAESQLATTTLMTPEFANFSGNVHGGHILRLVDQIAYACAASFSGQYCVTLSVDRVLFKVPVAVGDLVTMKAQVNRVGRSSLEVGVRVEARDLRGGTTRHTNSCFLTMVALKKGKPQLVPLLQPKSTDDYRRNDQAKRRLEQTRLADKVAANQVRYHDLIELASVATLITQAEGGEIQRVNQAACDLLGMTRESILATKICQLFPPDQHSIANQGYRNVVNLGMSEFLVEHASSNDTQRTTFRVTAWQLPLPSGPLIHSVIRRENPLT